jgi:hypothetical protein
MEKGVYIPSLATFFVVGEGAPKGRMRVIKIS